MDKITAFVLRRNRTEILLFHHENAGIQIPAGTVDEKEDILTAGVREACEETGLLIDQIIKKELLQNTYNELKGKEVVTNTQTIIYSRPRENSFSWVKIKRGVTLDKKKDENDYCLVEYREWNDENNKDYYSYRIQGWAKAEDLSDRKMRHFCIIDVEDSRNKWEVFIDNHTFKPFYAKLDNLPTIISPQDKWIDVLNKMIKKET